MVENHLFYQTDADLPLAVEARGIRLWDQDGREYIDGSSGAMVCHLGQGDWRVVQAMTRQAETIAFAYRTQFENQAALDLASKLVEKSAKHLRRVFFVTGGSESVEAAIKLARQYFYNRGQLERSVFISRRPSYHGSTLGALSLTAYQPLNAPFADMIQIYPKLTSPTQYRLPGNMSAESFALKCADELEETILEIGADKIAGFIAEPIGGASTGAEVPHDVYFPRIQEICHRHGVLLILDEVMTGLGRTGCWFGYEHWNVEADIVCLAKGLGAGYYPIAAIMTRSEITDALESDGGFMHGHTYAGTPVGCATGLVVMDIIEQDGLVGNAAAMGALLREGLENLKGKYAFIGDVRGKGLLQCLEFVADSENKSPFAPDQNVHERITARAKERGLLIYPRRSLDGIRGDHTLVAPPLCVTTDDVGEILRRLDRGLEDFQAKDLAEAMAA